MAKVSELQLYIHPSNEYSVLTSYMFKFSLGIIIRIFDFSSFCLFSQKKKNLILKIDVVKISLFIKYFFQIAIALPGAICGFCTKKNPYKGSIKKPT